jgi:hypothetical protein
MALAIKPQVITKIDTRKESHAIFWSDVQPSVIIPAVATDLDFPSVTIPASGIPTGSIITSVRAIIKWRKQVDTSTALNKISASSKTIRVKKSTGTWGVDDIVAINVPNNSLSTDASATEGGDLITGTSDIKAEVDAINATYNFRSEETNRTDAIIATGASLTLVDVQTALIVRWI